MGMNDEFVDREHDTENTKYAEYDSTVDTLETDGILAIRKIPEIRSANGLGYGLYGKADYHKESGSYITTLYCVFCFIPLIPLRRFRVIPGSSEFYSVSFSKNYNFMWELQLTKNQKYHRNILLISLAVLVLGLVAELRWGRP